MIDLHCIFILLCLLTKITYSSQSTNYVSIDKLLVQDVNEYYLDNNYS